ncbi:MAG: hypothetical protein R2764_20795 [Bacteroidales bacterium]
MLKGIFLKMPLELQNDLNNPNAVIQKGDRFGYDYTANINKYDLFTIGDFSYSKIDFLYRQKLNFDQF